MSTTLTLHDVQEALAELSTLLAAAEVEVTFHVVGGAAIMLTVRPDRQATADIDTWINTGGDADARSKVDTAIVEVARRRGWTEDWLNDKAQLFIPDDVGGGAAEWLLHSTTGRVCVMLARPDVLLAMKLRAGRGRRDLPDLAPLIAAAGYTTRDEVEGCFARHFPHDTMGRKAQAWIDSNYPD